MEKKEIYFNGIQITKKLKIKIQFLINFMNSILSIANNLIHWLCHLLIILVV